MHVHLNQMTEPLIHYSIMVLLILHSLSSMSTLQFDLKLSRLNLLKKYILPPTYMLSDESFKKISSLKIVI